MGNHALENRVTNANHFAPWRLGVNNHPLKMEKTLPYMDTQAAAYAEAGRFPEAAATAPKAVQIASSQGNTAMAQDIQSRLQSYQSAKPWRDK